MYVQRTNGVVSGIFANPQPGYAEEYLADDDVEVIAYINPTPTKQQRIDAILASVGAQQDWQVKAAAASVLALGLLQGLTEAQLYAANPGYKQSKDISDAIDAIRAEP